MTEPYSPPDQAERSRALHPFKSFLVEAPAGSGKTYLLTQRFLRLLALVERPEQIVAITFTNAAAAEMRFRILSELEADEASHSPDSDDPESLPALARRALDHANRLGWRILDHPAQLRITTIDAFCRALALQSPLSWGVLSSLGGALKIEQTGEQYRQAAKRTMELVADPSSETGHAIAALLLWRDNNWSDVETLIVQMLGQRNRWFQDFVFARDTDWALLRDRLEAPFRRAALDLLETLAVKLDNLPESREYALDLARFACQTPGPRSPHSLAGRPGIPTGFSDPANLEGAVDACQDLARFLLVKTGGWRSAKGLNSLYGFPASPTGKRGKDQFGDFVSSLAQEPGLREALAAFLETIPLRYTEEEWEIVRQCFRVLRAAAAQLQVSFAESGTVDFVEIAQIALRMLASDDGQPSDIAIRQAQGIRHLLVDEFQDTSRGQHQLLSRIIAAWPDTEGRTCFCVGDPMQSIYGFREAEVELFERTKRIGLGLHATGGTGVGLLKLETVRLTANFRTVPTLVDDLNRRFAAIFNRDAGPGIEVGPAFEPVQPARQSNATARAALHLDFTLASKADPTGIPDSALPGQTGPAQIARIVDLIEAKLEIMAAVKAAGGSHYRIAVLGRTKAPLIRIANALREAGVGCRAIDLVPLRERPEVLDALMLARALLNPVDRTAWLAVLRAPWCGLSLDDLYRITSADEPAHLSMPIPQLLKARLPQIEMEISPAGFAAATRVTRVMAKASDSRPNLIALGTWLESVWKALGGDATVTAEERNNLDLLWAALDGLPNGELDLHGPGLEAALDKLFAQPDPEASDDFGVQLMTIHKSKGLEFEVVLVPALESEGQKYDHAMVSWLERGLSGGGLPEETDSPTEFLIAPIQTKGAGSGAAKRWVDAVKRERESQELRRLLYVAATRAREELHLFARPRFTVDTKAKQLVLAGPKGLLKTAWPAFREEIEDQFADWAVPVAEGAFASRAIDVAAQELLIMPSPAMLGPVSPSSVKPTLLKQLPASFVAPTPRWAKSSRGEGATEQPGEQEPGELYPRTQGGVESRLLGQAVHLLLERLAKRIAGLKTAANGGIDPRSLLSTDSLAAAAELRCHGLAPRKAAQMAAEALALISRAATDPVCAWILGPHPHAETESRWTGVVSGTGSASSHKSTCFNLRPDRVFFAAPCPELAADQSIPASPQWWVIDWKTAHASPAALADPTSREAFQQEHRSRYAPQLAAYAQVLRALLEGGAFSSDPNLDLRAKIRAGIYYPGLLLFDSWEV